MNIWSLITTVICNWEPKTCSTLGKSENVKYDHDFKNSNIKFKYKADRYRTRQEIQLNETIQSFY